MEKKITFKKLELPQIIHSYDVRGYKIIYHGVLSDRKPKVTVDNENKVLHIYEP